MSNWGLNFSSVTGNWPVTDSGEPESPAFLERVYGNETELALRRNMLWAYGVPSVARYPMDGALGKVVLGQSGFGMDIFVPESMLGDAENIIGGEDSAEIEIDQINDNEEENEL